MTLYMRRATLLMALGLFACKKDAPPAAAKGAAPAVDEAGPKTLRGVDRARFNTLAVELDVPVFWVEDADGDGALDVDELAHLWTRAATAREDWIKKGGFNAPMTKAHEAIVARAEAGAPDEAKLPEAERARRAAVRKELAQGRPTAVLNDFSGASAEDRAIVTHVLEAARAIEQIFAQQNGVDGMAAKIPPDDTASRALFRRNQGPWCVAPKTESDPNCHALASKPKRSSGLYPTALQDEGFCEALAQREDADALLHQFHVVRGADDALEAVPYSEAYAPLMKVVSAELTAAADAIESEDEAAFEAYLRAAAKAFSTNDWVPADEAWSKMNVHNSKWYLRIGPDEVYFEPCSRKAGFHVSFARINQDSLTWQKKLDPVKGDMEKALAQLAGKPYRARDVSFHLPDFIDIVVNAGDSRAPHGATIGQSLPNWGPVANEGRGRTVAMTNLYTDADSKAELTKQVKSILCTEAMARYVDRPDPQIMSTVLHEAAHNLGPAHEYKVAGRTASQVFGGPLASTLEELKAQTAALYFTDWLVEKEIIDQTAADEAHTRDLVWSFGHISRGMYTATGKPKPYSQLAAIQLGFLEEAGAVEWRAEAKAANGTDVGCLMIHLDRFAPAAKDLMTQVAGIKARGDKKAALKMRAKFVDAEDKQARMKTITERWLRAPKASFVYSVKL